MPDTKRLLFAIVIALGLSASQTIPAGITLPQANGETLKLAAPAKRIITLAPNLAELLFAAGAGDRDRPRARARIEARVEALEGVVRVQGRRTSTERVDRGRQRRVLGTDAGCPFKRLDERERRARTTGEQERVARAQVALVERTSP